ncbi:MAG: hypothetical protein M1828_000704 [Chrysothrix sp. TS-e1954]|nr:MAG: hypothetical protein M1828_000704 [Chrysothrix sp. TS-e1954]
MAANDYYNPHSDSATPTSNYLGADRPPFSARSPTLQSPYRDQLSPAPSYDAGYSSGPYRSPSQQGYGGMNKHHLHDTDPLTSSDSIPLQPQHPKADSSAYFPQESDLGLHRQASDTLPLNPTDAEQSRGLPRSRRLNWKTIPWVVYILSIIQLAVFIAALVKNAQLTGSVIETHPTFNPMIGPSPYVLINMGARYVSCMRNEEGVQNNEKAINWPCPNTTSTDGAFCSLSELCGFGGVPNPHVGGSLNDTPAPNQWFRFITPIFLHGGIIHIGGNLLLQLLLGRDMEKTIGSIRFFLVYFSSGIFGFVMGGNFAASGIAATGCSGSLFGIIGLVFINLLYTFQERRHPWFDLIFLVVMVVIEVVIGLLPTGLDNFSHIGGLLMGLVLGVCVLHSPSALRKHTEGVQPSVYEESREERRKRAAPVSADGLIYGTQGESTSEFFKHPIAFFKDRKPLWWAWWLLRAGALVAVLVSFIVLINNFYNHRYNCSWCKYLSCINYHNWCSLGELQTGTSTPAPTSTNPARMF